MSQSTNSSGPPDKPWQAIFLAADGQKECLGSFDTQEQAMAALEKYLNITPQDIILKKVSWVSNQSDTVLMMSVISGFVAHTPESPKHADVLLD